jgi:hypothetical protein
MCQKIQRLSWDSLRMDPTSAETRSYNRPDLLVGEHKLHFGNIMCGGHIDYMFITTFFISFMRAFSTKTTSTAYGTAYFVSTTSSLAVPSVLSLAHTKAWTQLSP